MDKEEIIERLEEIAKHAVHVLGEEPLFMSLDDGIAIHEAIDILKFAQPERKKGKWTEKHHAYSDEESVIEEWQSCRCSECGRYDTRPYMYYFSEPNYCSYCGADMREDNE